MKRSEINGLIAAAQRCFAEHGWALPPNPKWDVTDFGLGDWRRHGLVLVNLADEPEYCEKLMYAHRGMITPKHKHRIKKEDIICRWGGLKVTCWSEIELLLKIDGEPTKLKAGEPFVLEAGSRITLTPGIWHEFEPESDEVIIGEVSTANDDLNDNIFENGGVGRFPEVEENEFLAASERHTPL